MPQLLIKIITLILLMAAFVAIVIVVQGVLKLRGSWMSGCFLLDFGFTCGVDESTVHVTFRP